MNKQTLGLCCEPMVRKADIEESKSAVDLNSYAPQASYPCGNFSDTSRLSVGGSKGSLGLVFAPVGVTAAFGEGGIWPYLRRKISVLPEPPLGHLCCVITVVPPQPNSPLAVVLFRHMDDSIYIWNRLSKSKQSVVGGGGVSLFPKVPPTLHPPRHSTAAN